MPPGLHFLGQALEHLHGQVVDVELGQTGLNGVVEPALRGVVYEVDNRNEVGPGRADGFVDLEVVTLVAGKPVNLVHDDVPDLPGCQLAQHALEVRPVG